MIINEIDCGRTVAERVLNPQVYRKGNHYLYQLHDAADRVPRYIGITGCKPKQRLANHFYSIYKSKGFETWLATADVEMLILLESTREFVWAMEKELMRQYPQGQLFNGQGFICDDPESEWYRQRKQTNYAMPYAREQEKPNTVPTEKDFDFGA